MEPAFASPTDEIHALEDLLGHCWLHMDSGFIRSKMGSDERALFDRAIARWSARLDDTPPDEADQIHLRPLRDVPTGWLARNGVDHPWVRAGDPSLGTSFDRVVQCRPHIVAAGEQSETRPSTEPNTTTASMSLSDVQQRIHAHAVVAWPGLTTEIEVLALAEEVGEVARAVLKRTQAIRGSSDDWSAELRREVGDVLLVLCNIASLEGFELSETVAERLAVVLDRDPNHSPVQSAPPPTL